MSELKVPDFSDLVKSSAEDIRSFMGSIIWQDMTRVLEDWESGLKKDYDEAESIEEVRKLQGISTLLSYMKKLPEAMISIAMMTAEERDKKHKEEL